MRLTLFSASALCLTSLLSASEPLPSGWALAGDKPSEYAVTIDPSEHAGKRTAHLFCVARQPSGFGTLMQVFDASRKIPK